MYTSHRRLSQPHPCLLASRMIWKDSTRKFCTTTLSCIFTMCRLGQSQRTSHNTIVCGLGDGVKQCTRCILPNRSRWSSSDVSPTRYALSFFLARAGALVVPWRQTTPCDINTNYACPWILQWCRYHATVTDTTGLDAIRADDSVVDFVEADQGTYEIYVA